MSNVWASHEPYVARRSPHALSGSRARWPDIMSEEAINGSHSPADYFRIAGEYESGRNGRGRDLEQAAAYMIRAAEAGHCGATYEVCALYFHGKGVPQDLEIARSWAMRVRAQGSIELADKALSLIDEKQRGMGASLSPRESTATSRLSSMDEKNELSGRSSLLLPIYFLVGVGLLLYVASELDNAYPGLGRSFIGWVFGLGALGILLNIVWGRTVKETKKNFSELLRETAIAMLGICLLASVGYCSGGAKNFENDGPGEVPDQIRKP